MLCRVEFGTIMLWYYAVDRTSLFSYGKKVRSPDSNPVLPFLSLLEGAVHNHEPLSQICCLLRMCMAPSDALSCRLK